MYISFLITARCNAQCRHCSTDCGPQRSEHLQRGEIMALMDQAAALADGKPLEFSISGGEPFLDYELLQAVIAHGHALGATLCCVTNASWAHSPEKALRLLKPLRDAGLNLLAVSNSRFHRAYIKPARVRHALAAAQALGLETQLKHVATNSDGAPEQAMLQWAQAAQLDQVQRIPILPSLRAGETLPEQDYARPHALPQGGCPAAALTIREDGAAYGCCTPGAFGDFFRLGNVRETRLADIQRNFAGSSRHRLLRERGPAFVAQRIAERGLAGRLRSRYTSVCDLCTHIAADPALAAVADDCARDQDMQQLQQIFGPSAETPAPRGQALTTGE